MRNLNYQGFRQIFTAVGAILLGHLFIGSTTNAQPTENQMCGGSDGTVFTVDLPGVGGAPPDSVTLPKGCRVYALLVSGYSRNRNFDELTFYKLAKFVAENDGYVHWAWWNNLLGEYMSRPLHSVSSTPGNLASEHVRGFAPIDLGADKAIPEEDFQFQNDAALFLKKVREHNPNAIIVVAGHSMGGDSIVRLVTRDDKISEPSAKNVLIDILAPIDPVGNRNTPVGIPANLTPDHPENFTYNWNRWRVAYDMRGWYQRDCIRDGRFCKDFDARPFRVRYECKAEILDSPPLLGTLAPGICSPPRDKVALGPRPVIGDNVRFLYHRWQIESFFPFDYMMDQPLVRAGPPSTDIFGRNFQKPVLANELFGRDRDKTCGNLLLFDPRDPTFTIHCDPIDGHGEIVGHRGVPPIPIGLKARLWFGNRRQKIIEMATAPSPGDSPGWIHEPSNPNLDLIVDDLIANVQHLLEGAPVVIDNIAPTSNAILTPESNDNGWNDGNVALTLTASDGIGAGVREIEFSLSGAQSGDGIENGDAVELNIHEEGVTTVTFFARDRAGNYETPANTIQVRVDKTAPEIDASVSREPNANGWHNGDVTIDFSAFDNLSGVAELSPEDPVVVTEEGAEQEIVGTASDLAGNQSALGILVSIDKTSPGIEIMHPANAAVYLLNSAVNASYRCTDLLSGIDSCYGPVANGALVDTATVNNKEFTVNASDLAGNDTSLTQMYSVQYAFSGFRNPVSAAPEVNVANGGSTIPIKYRLSDANGMSISNMGSFVSLRSAPIPCTAGIPDVVVGEEAIPTGGTGLRYDGSQFIFNWKTSKSWTGCRALQLTLNDGTRHFALFRFR